MILIYFGLPLLLVLYLNISATVHLHRRGPRMYEKSQIRRQIAMIWLFPFVGALFVKYFLVEKRITGHQDNATERTDVDSLVYKESPNHFPDDSNHDPGDMEHDTE